MLYISILDNQVTLQFMYMDFASCGSSSLQSPHKQSLAVEQIVTKDFHSIWLSLIIHRNLLIQIYNASICQTSPCHNRDSPQNRARVGLVSYPLRHNAHYIS